MVWVFCLGLTTDSDADDGATVEVEYPTERKGQISWNTFVPPTYIGVGETISECGYSPEDIRVNVDSSDVWHGSIYYYAEHTPGKKRKYFFHLKISCNF